MIKIKTQSPEESKIKFLPSVNQAYFDNKIRTPINQPVNVEIQGSKSSVKTYTWNMGDDLPHSNAQKTKALYTIGGLYDLILRTDTDSGSYRISTYENCVDVVEPVNLWAWTLENKQQIRASEFGLISEVFKSSNNTCSLNASDTFLNNDRAIHEFWRITYSIRM